jgi:hypothetical protein
VVAVATGSRSQAEVAIVGWEGMTGLPVVLRAGRSPCEVFIQVEGHGQCIQADDLLSAMSQSAALQDTLLRFAHVFTVQSGYTANGKIEERLARWLLMAQDRIANDELLLTHEFLSLMLGVRRAGVTAALQHFEGSGLSLPPTAAVSPSRIATGWRRALTVCMARPKPSTNVSLPRRWVQKRTDSR